VGCYVPTCTYFFWGTPFHDLRGAFL
jgi:hypothetical protein